MTYPPTRTPGAHYVDRPSARQLWSRNRLALALVCRLDTSHPQVLAVIRALNGWTEDEVTAGRRAGHR